MESLLQLSFAAALLFGVYCELRTLGLSVGLIAKTLIYRQTQTDLTEHALDYQHLSFTSESILCRAHEKILAEINEHKSRLRKTHSQNVQPMMAYRSSVLEFIISLLEDESRS